MDAERREWRLFPQDGYEMQSTRPKEKKSEQLVIRRKRKYEKEGMRRSVRGILMMHVHGQPHVLALQEEGERTGERVPGAPGSYSLPGGSLRPGESDRDGLNRKLKRLIANTDPDTVCEWQVGDLISIWWSPHFEGPIYPYLPQHVTRPKECIRVYQVTLPPKCLMLVPEPKKLVAVPFFDLYKDQQNYDPMIWDIPQLVSKYVMGCYDATTTKPS